MKLAINMSKITPPRLQRTMERPRLLEYLMKNNDKRVVLILGQAAQGKSTLGASYTKISKIPSAWINLSRDESDPVNLFYLLVASMQNVFKGSDLSSLLLYPSVNRGPRLEIPLFEEWTKALSQFISTPLQFILDGLDRLSPDAASLKFLRLLIRDLPDGTNLILLSRRLPTFDLQGLKLKQKACIITNDDLAFTLQEVKTYCKMIRKLSLRTEQIKRIHRFTEGWIGGLVLLSENLEKLNDVSREKYLSEDIPKQFKKEIFQYIGEEVFSNQPDFFQDFLIRSSIIDVLEPGFLDELLRINNANEILERMAEANLFVSSIYNERNVSLFRYHLLFRDFLNTKLNVELGGKGRQALSIRAGTIYEERGELEFAVRHYLDGKNFKAAANVMQYAGMDLLKLGRISDLNYWLQSLPENMVEDNPWLLFYRCMTRRFKGVQENLRKLPIALERFKEQNDMQGVLLCSAGILEAIIAAGLKWKYLKKALEKAEALLDAEHIDTYPYEKALLFSQYGYGHTLRGNIPQGILALQKCFLLSSSLKDPMLQADCLSHCIVAFTMMGDYLSAAEYSKKLEKAAGECPLPELKTLYFVVNSMLCSFKGEAEEAKKLIEMALEQVENNGLVYYYPVTLMYKVFYCAFSEIYSEMDSVGNQLVQLASSMGNPVLEASTTFFLGLNAYREGNYKKAKKLIECAHQICSPKMTNTQMQWYASKLVRNLLSLELKDESGTERDLEEALGFYTRINNQRFMAEIHLTMALLKWQKNEKDESLGHLTEGFGLAEEVQHDHFLIMNQKDRTKACILAIELGSDRSFHYAERLLVTKFAPWSETELKRLMLSKNKSIRRKAIDIMIAIRRESVPSLKMITLGRFRVLKGDIPVKRKEWQGEQPKALLKSIITHGLRGVSPELIMEDIWPESETGEKRFKVLLHRLRKSLEPDMEQTVGSCYVHLKKNRLYLDEDLCVIDAQRFRTIVEQGVKKQESGDSKAALVLFKEAMDIYKGDFLPEDLYSLPIEQKREKLRRMYLDVLIRMARIYEDRGTMSRAISLYRKVVQTDALMEKAYQRMMMLYFERGERNEAIRVYEDCKKALSEILDSEPDRVTTSIYNKILGS